MKKHFKFLPFLFFGLCLVLNSCSPDELSTIRNSDDQSNFKNAGEPIILPDIETRLSQLNNLKELTEGLSLAYQNHNNEQTFFDVPSNELIKQQIINQTKVIYTNLGVEESDLLLEVGSEGDLDLFYLGTGIVAGGSYENATESAFVDCLLEVVGITALVQAGEALGTLYVGEVAASAAVDAAAAAFRSAALKAAKKIITIFAGPFGAAIMVGEFIYYMT
ncbi:hypothetical protein [Nonlabens sp.]|uniref:hypothetical protein n=1 Tax=Nonlabens sp. TaxID=1888209 RepID=UPI003F6A2F28